MIRESLVLSYCWVCQTTDTSFEQHHLVPRCFGGENGPTVTLCESCHTIAHENAENIYHGHPLTTYNEVEKTTRSHYLSRVIVNARLAVEASPTNKKYKFATTFNSSTHDKLVRLVSHYNSSQQKVIIYAINSLYAKLFQDQ